MLFQMVKYILNKIKCKEVDIHLIVSLEGGY
jgi:hypothetical protein